MVEKKSPRVEVDTSAPFDSVKEAASRFGEVGYWRRCSFQNQAEVDVEEQAKILEKEVISKEKETLDILKQLESTKSLIEELKSKLQSEDSLKKAKANLTRTTSDLTGIRSSVEKLNDILESENANLKRAYDRIALKASKIVSLDEEVTVEKLENPRDTTEELQRLTREIDDFNKLGKSAKAETLKAISEIEHTKSRIKTIEASTTAARKVREAARAVESSALLKCKALSKDSLQEVSLSLEEYSDLKDRSHRAEEHAAAKITEALKLIDMAVTSKSEIVKKVEEATEEVKKSKEVLEEALRRVDAANVEKMRVEETLRKKRSDRGSRRSQVKNCYPMKDRGSEMKTESIPTVSIGEILRSKLSAREMNEKAKENRDTKRKKFEFGLFSGILVKNTKKLSVTDLR